MIFAHDTEVALQSAAALVNTLPGSIPEDTDEDTLTTVAELDEFLSRFEWFGRHERTVTELEQVRALRPRLAALWGLDEDAAVAEVNAMLAENGALPQLVRHGEWPGTCTRRPPTPRWPPGWPSRRRWPWST